MYLASAVLGKRILVHLPTWREGSYFNICLSASRFQEAGRASPVSLSLIPHMAVIFWLSSVTAFSTSARELW